MGILFVGACGGGELSAPPSGAGVNGQPLRACASDGDCSRPQPYCLPGGGYCVECLGPANCGGRQCGPTYQCVECTSNAQCGGPLPYCSPTTYQCVQCVGNSNCAQGQTCSATNECVLACTSDAMCPPLAPHCSPTLGTCVACNANTDCGGFNPYCNPDNGVCVQCLTDANCAGVNGGGGSCRGSRCR